MEFWFAIHFCVLKARIVHVTGILLSGPHGCGKKSLVRHVSALCGTSVIHVDCSVHGSRPGESERNLQKAFRQAANETADEESCCILFLEELDAICPRKADAGNEGDSLATRTLAELVKLMDALHERRQSRLVVIATTNKPSDIDPCLRRFGRFEKEVLLFLYQYHSSYCVISSHL